jgi:hypothetical protein
MVKTGVLMQEKSTIVKPTAILPCLARCDRAIQDCFRVCDAVLYRGVPLNIERHPLRCDT